MLIINGAVIFGCAVFNYEMRGLLLTGLLLLLPFVDPYWQKPVFKVNPYRGLLWLLVGGALWGLLSFDLYAALAMVMLTALPEEWFFRAYFMRRLESLYASKWLANVSTSVLFSLLHVPVQGWAGLAVFFPSLFFGWLYQRYEDFILLVLLHALSNVLFFMFIKDWLFY